MDKHTAAVLGEEAARIRAQTLPGSNADSDIDVEADDLEDTNASRGLSVTRSCTLCRALVQDIQVAFPREIRDFIWTALLALEWSATADIDGVLCSKYDPVGARYERGEDPWFVQACFVGDEARREILELRYKEVLSDLNIERSVSFLRTLTTDDAFHTGMGPAQFLRKLSLHWNLKGVKDACHGTEESLRDPAYWPQDGFTESWTSCFGALRHIRHKAAFEMQFVMREANEELSVKHLAHLLRTFKPVYDELSAAGAKITISLDRWYYVHEASPLELNDVFSGTTGVWDAHLRERIEAWDRETTEKGFITPRDWDVEGDKQFDELFEKGIIQY
ncbi:hypothetical protein BKA63DRAFT_242415 [Paraphoma chrysanthemicola]|nr:hypothetical protein BKA63DRAFT_242415 [Paraphoma chrysanthemicola]